MTAELYAEGIMGRDAEDFIQGDLGQYLIGCAEQEIKTATDALKKVHPWRTRRIRELQNEIWRAESFQSWLSELVIRGRQAVQQREPGRCLLGRATQKRYPAGRGNTRSSRRRTRTDRTRTDDG